MKRIIESRKLLGVDKEVDLKELKSIYRTFMKENHPDKFQDEKIRAEAEERSKEFIEAYHLLVSVNPETHALQEESYSELVNNSRIVNFQLKSQTLSINFADGSAFEYFGVPKNVYNKFINSDSPDRFGRRHIYHSFLYRKMTSAMETV